ncbi:CoA-transferase [Flavonifractor sp. AGMB03687]|uniref:acyl CoA:acetate/3-ketoacid CoA transferase n=1 Tax=Flavonifractor sp. AGMB03687 TaxID=2785133 RepID=UPI001ADFC139|nr:CoA-transferase [Flavonifractor sp. AGMB03687]
MARLITPREAADLVQDGAVLALGGFGAYCGPDALLDALASRFQESRHPAGLTVVTGISTGDNTQNDVGMNRIAQEGLIDTIIAGHLANPPKISAMAASNQLAAYTLPLGVVMHLFRAIAGKKPGVLTQVGLNTFVDPRNEGCKANDRAREQGREVVKLVELAGQEQLFYPAFPLDICFLRGTYADEDGNISIEHEGLTGAELEIAAAVHNSGGIVVVQVEDLVQRGTIHPRKVRIHRSLVDYVVKTPSADLHMQNYAGTGYQPALTGEIRCPTDAIAPMSMSIRKVIARRGAMELKPGCMINLGIGIPSGVGSVANEEGIAEQTTLSLESGPIGGVPVEGVGFAGSMNPEVINSICDTFDLYDGGFLDMTFLGAAEIDAQGNVNVSKFGPRCPGPGGFINISQNTPSVNFMGAFTAGKSDIRVQDGKLNIVTDGPGVKFINKVQQITFSADYARKTGQNVTYMTERAVFKLVKDGIMLTEIAPGVDLERDILAHMEFRPLISPDLKEMDPRIFREEKMGLHF